MYKNPGNIVYLNGLRFKAGLGAFLTIMEKNVKATYL